MERMAMMIMSAIMLLTATACEAAPASDDDAAASGTNTTAGQAAATRPVPQGNRDIGGRPYAPLKTRPIGNGKVEFVGWTKTGENTWSADPQDSAAPRAFTVTHGPNVIQPRAAFDIALKQAGINAAANFASKEITTWQVLTNTSGKAWASAATAKVGGVDQSLFAVTLFSKRNGVYETSFFMIPTVHYRKWGGVMTMLDAFNITSHVEGLPDSFAALARNATPREQAQIFADILDITTTRIALDGMKARAGLLQSLQGVGRDISTRTDCLQTPGCSFVPGALPGQGTTSITR